MTRNLPTVIAKRWRKPKQPNILAHVNASLEIEEDAIAFVLPLSQ